MKLKTPPQKVIRTRTLFVEHGIMAQNPRWLKCLSQRKLSSCIIQSERTFNTIHCFSIY